MQNYATIARRNISQSLHLSVSLAQSSRRVTMFVIFASKKDFSFRRSRCKILSNWYIMSLVKMCIDCGEQIKIENRPMDCVQARNSSLIIILFVTPSHQMLTTRTRQIQKIWLAKIWRNRRREQRAHTQTGNCREQAEEHRIILFALIINKYS